MSNDGVALIGAMIAKELICYDHGQEFVEFLQHVDAQIAEPFGTVAEAVDAALGFFNDDPDAEAQKVAERSVVAHDPDICPDCGGPMDDGDELDDIDLDNAFTLFHTVRNMMAKTYFEIDASIYGGPPESHGNH